MSESLFQISCPSCESVFAVTDPELVGQIIACPKCGGMMLVEAAETAEDAKFTQSGEVGASAESDEIAQNAETFSNVEASLFEKTTREERVAGNGQDKENREDGGRGESGKETASGAEENDAPLERSRGGGKAVAGGIALALVGALTFWGLRSVNDESAPTSETNVEAENSENGGNGEETSSGAKDDVGGFAPFAVEERTGENEEEAEFLPNDSPELETGEDAPFSEDVEGETVEETSENAQDLSAPTDGLSEETEENKGNSEDSGNDKDGEDGALETSEENASDEGDVVAENDADLGDLDDLEGLGDLEEVDALNVEENEADDALESLDEETTAGEKLAGSDASTGFNEADFERANQNDDPESADEPAEVDWSGVASTTNPTLQGALPTLRRERKEIDVDARLALPIKSIEFPASPVAAIRLLSEFTGVSIVPDLEAFALTRPSTNATLDLSLRDTTAGEALENVAELLKWEVYKEKERILIRPSDYEPENLVEERFDVADLTTARAEKRDATQLDMFELPNNLTSETLAVLIQSTVAPETWARNGGAANLTIDGSTLTVSQSAQNREKTRALLEGLRALRGLEPQGDASPERIIPEKLGWENLTKRMNFAPLAPLALQNAIEILEKSQKIQVFWDDATLIEAGVGRDATTAVKIEKGTIDAILSDILEPLNATYLILSENVILITEKKAAESYQTVEFFSLVGADGTRPSLEEARALVGEIKRAIAPESWRKSGEPVDENASNEETAKSAEDTESKENGEDEETARNAEIGEDALNVALEENGEDATSEKAACDEPTGVIWLDVESSCLIIRQSQPNQRALRRWLAARLNDSAEAAKEKTP